jgi:uncharacterized protein (DUF1330 family)
MSAYLIFTRDETIDEKELATYSKDVPATLAGHEATVLALYGQHQDLEGAATEGTVILEFPTMEAAKAWYDGPAYRKVREHCFKGATNRVTLVDGVYEVEIAMNCGRVRLMTAGAPIGLRFCGAREF